MAESTPMARPFHAPAALLGLSLFALSTSLLAAPPLEGSSPDKTSPAIGNPDGSELEATRKINLAPQPALETAPSARRTFHTHDGFYLRASFGVGDYWAAYDEEDGDAELDATGWGLGADLLIGGSPTPGIAIGGGLLTTTLLNAQLTGTEESSGSLLSSSLLGVFADAATGPHSPWHFGGLLGLAQMRLDQPEFVGTASGVGGAAWGGYDAWVGPDWAMGGMLRFAAAYTAGSRADREMSGSSASLTLLMTLLYH